MDFTGSADPDSGVPDPTRHPRGDESTPGGGLHHLLVEHSPDAILVHCNGRLVFANAAAAKLLGAEQPQQLLGRPVAELVPLESRASVQAGRGELFPIRGKISTAEITLVRIDGATVATEIRAAQIPYEGKSGVQVVARDITARKQSEAQDLRRRRMEAIGSLAGGFAHDFNNALAPILLATEILRKECVAPESARVLDTIRGSAQRGADMVRQVLTFARGARDERVAVRVKHLVNEILDIARYTFPKSIQIKTDISRGLWSIVGDPLQLHQVIFNLCLNARDAMPRGGTLTIAAANLRLDDKGIRISPDARPGPYIVLTVADTGIGMSEDVRARIFDPFFSTKTPDKGTGLGLATALAIVKDHQGFITVRSEVGKGTEFKAYLPAEEAPSAFTTTLPPASPQLGRDELILVVDEEATTRNLVSQTLQMSGYQVVVARDGAQAVALCGRPTTAPQLMITDFSMPTMSGPATIMAVRAVAPRIKIILAITSDSDLAPAERAELKVQAVIAKPYRGDKLLRTVYQVLHEAG